MANVAPIRSSARVVNENMMVCFLNENNGGLKREEVSFL